MDLKFNISLDHLNPATIGFYNYILQEKSNPNSIATHIRIPDTCELLQLIENDFEKLQNPTTLSGILKILHVTIEHMTSEHKLLNFMRNLLAEHTANEEDGIITARIIYEILSALPKNFPVEHFHTSGFVTEISTNRHMDNLKLQTQLAHCISLLIGKFKIKTLLERVWKQILTNHTYLLVVHYIEPLISENYIYERIEFWQLIKTLLSAEIRDDRKLAIFLIRKVLNFLSTALTDTEVKGFFSWSKEFSKIRLSSWMTYLTILENLEEKQSHLILPSLAMLENLTLGENTPWIRIVLKQMLKHNNTLVLRWSVDYLFRNFTTLVLDNQILLEFLYATNNTWLFHEHTANAFALPALSLSDQTRFLEAFGMVSWRSVPMHDWLLRMKTVQWSKVECKLVINIATKLRQLQNRCIRSDCRDLFTSIFQLSLFDMALNDFMILLDALYSCTDQISEDLLYALVYKIESSPRPFISFNVSTILRRQTVPIEYENMLMNAFDKVKMEDHQWFCILVQFGFRESSQKQEFCQKHYGIVVSQPYTPIKSLEEAMSEHVAKLSWDEFSKAVVREATVDRFTINSENISQSNYEDLLESGSTKTLINIVNPVERRFPMDVALFDRSIAELRIADKNNLDTNMLISNLIASCEKDQPELLYENVNRILDTVVTNNRLALNVFTSVLPKCDYNKTQGRQLIIRGILFGEPLSGDLSVEHDYAVRIKRSKEFGSPPTNEVRQICLGFLERLNVASIKLLKRDLIAESKRLSLKKPRYFENSKHHRLKLRIAQALAALNRKAPSWDDYYLYSILQENNQTNVRYIYEFIVATTISESDLVQQMENVEKHSSSCQASMFAISYLFAVYHGYCETLVTKLITLLLPWTMSAIFNTRLYAQITIHHLLQRFPINSFDHLKIGIAKSLSESPNAYAKWTTDVRYNFPADLNFLDTDPILFVTIVPEDEHQSSQLDYLNKFKSLAAARSFSLSKQESLKEKPQSRPVIDDVQRKMNPQMDISNGHLAESKERTTDMIVVASLIDKLPNLGGIARTCEVLGIKHLILDSTKHAQSKEFKSLSMTAENWITISEVKLKALREFFMAKKTEGYKIVGAEQTAKSINFMEFEFPDKCVLLLGHEKEGIPVDLIAFLDYAVEIPQFGMVRSLNVHVTGALFIYEYCKQHLANPTMNLNKCQGVVKDK